MSTLTDKDIIKIAHLAKLDIAIKDLDSHAQNLSKILAFVEQINNVDTDNIEPIGHPIEGAQIMRTDEITEENQRDLFQSIAPKTEAGLYLVPKVIEACDTNA